MNNKILLVDDDRNFRTIVRKKIQQKRDCHILEANNGQKALQVLKKNDDVKLILLDMIMPVMDGYTFLKKIRQEGCFIPVIILTGANSHNFANLEVFTILEKPIDFEELSKKISSALYLHDHRDEVLNKILTLSQTIERKYNIKAAMV